MSGLTSGLDPVALDPAYTPLKEYLIQTTGLAYYSGKDAEFSGRLGRRFATAGVADCGSYLKLLRDPVRGPDELDALVAEITIGETYFFRHAEHFAALRDEVLPDLIERNRATRRLRIWSAACADGPEPYSLAILLRRDLAAQLAGWNVTILGTDINRRALARAREGVFAEWALRALPEEERHRCFEKRNASWVIAPQYREGVSFQYHNLAEDPFPSLIHNLAFFDLIVCRNVMIYFSPDVMHRTVLRFHQCLVPGGWMLVGPSEPNMTCFTAFEVRNAPGVTLYRKPEAEAPAAPARWEPPLVETWEAPRTEPATAPAANGSPAKAPDGPTLAGVRTHADRGEWKEAARCCQALLAADNLNASLHFHYGLILEQLQQHAEAETCLRRAIYLDRRSVLAHYYLGLLLQSRGEWRQASRSFQNALDLLRTHQAGERFADADGITALELQKLASMHFESLRAYAAPEVPA